MAVARCAFTFATPILAKMAVRVQLLGFGKTTNRDGGYYGNAAKREACSHALCHVSLSWLCRGLRSWILWGAGGKNGFIVLDLI